MANPIPLIVFPVKDIRKAKYFYNTFLDAKPYVDGAWYVGYKLDGLEVGLDPNGKAVVSYIDVDDIAARLETLEKAGAAIVMQPKDVGGGLLVAQVEIEGNILGLRQQAK